MNLISILTLIKSLKLDLNKVKEKILLAKKNCYVTTPVTSAIKAFKQMNIKNIALFTPYPDAVNKTILDYFIQMI